MKAWLERTMSGWRPSDEDSLRVAKKVPVGTHVEADIIIRQSRSRAWNRRYWVLLSMVASNVEHIEIAPGVLMPIHDKDDAHVAMKFLTGWVDTYTTVVDGQSHILRIPKSTNFEQMDADEWAAYYNKVRDAVFQHVLPGVDEYVEEELARMAS